MGTTLEGKQINQTYQALLKTTDNTEVSATAKEITDGKGNGTGVTLDNSGNLVANDTVTANAFEGDGSQLTNVPYPVTSVNTQTGDVVLDTDDVAEGSNEYYTDAKVEANSAVSANTAKVGITTQQASDIQTNNSKVGITTEQASEIAANTLKVGITTEQANEIAANTLKTGITQSQADAISANTLKNSYPTDDASKLLGIEAGAEVNTVDSVNSLTGAVSLGLLDLDDVGADGNSGEVLTTNGAGSFTFAPAGGGTGTVTSVNGSTGAVVLDTDDIDEGTNNQYYTEARVSANTSVVANTAKVGITTQQAADITTNNAKNSYPTTDAAKVGFISVTQAVDLDTIESDVAANNAKVGITTQQASEITANTLKTGITSTQASNITANNAKVSMVLGTSAGTALEGDTELLQLGTTSSTALAGDTTTISGQQASDISTNNAKVGITTSQADAIVANTAKTGITTEQASAIVANTSKVGITTQQASDITANNAKVGITTQQAADIVTNNSKNSYPSGDSTKVGFISVTQAVDLDTIESDVATNNAKTGITSQQATDITANNAKVGITTTQANNITTNNAKISFDSTSSTKLAGIAENATNVTNNNQITNGAGYTTNVGTVTNVTVGTGLDVTSGTTTPSLSLDLSEFTDMTADMVGTDEFIVLDSSSERRKAANEIESTILNLEKQSNAIGNAIDFSARVTLDGGVAEGTSGIIKNLQNIL